MGEVYGTSTNLSALGGEEGGEERSCFFISSCRLNPGQLSDNSLRRSTVCCSGWVDG